jgi:hypothetical protein
LLPSVCHISVTADAHRLTLWNEESSYLGGKFVANKVYGVWELGEDPEHSLLCCIALYSLAAACVLDVSHLLHTYCEMETEDSRFDYLTY